MPAVTTVEYDGAAIRERREYLGYTLEDIAPKVDRSVSTLSDIERGRRPKAALVLLGKLARELGTTTEAFIKSGDRAGEAA